MPASGQIIEARRVSGALDPSFAAEVIARAEGAEALLGCIQCGACSGACPLSAAMDLTPRRLIGLTRAGAREAVLGSTAIWVCASCYACTVTCPKQVPITEIVHALRRMALDADAYPKRFTNPVMTRELVGMAERRGRTTESWIATRSYLKTDPGQLLKHARVGFRLFRRGRMSLRRDAVRNRRQIAELLRAVEEAP